MKLDKKPILEVAEIIMGQSPTGDTYNTIGDGLPLLNGPTEFGYYNPECTLYTTDSKREGKLGDLIFCVRGSTTGRMNWADQIYSLGRGVCAIRGESFLKSKYIKYCLDAYLAGLLQLAGGGTFPNLSRSDIAGFKIPYSKKVEEIASILLAYDNLIENNLKRIKLLEEKAQLHYKDLIKESANWDKIRLEEFVSVVKGRKPSKVFEQPEEECQLYLLLDTVERVKTLYTSDLTLPQARITDVLMCMDGARSGLSFRGMIGAIGSTMAIWRSNSEIISGELLYQFMKQNESAITQGNTGAAIPHANRKFIFDMKISVPKKKDAEFFEKSNSPVVKLINTLYEQNTKLREARDILLPKLMNGQIEV
jgi:type I restriction enzyme S subunit